MPKTIARKPAAGFSFCRPLPDPMGFKVTNDSSAVPIPLRADFDAGQLDL
jgi:hypothetical protein